MNTISLVLLIYSMLSSKTPISLPGKLTSDKNYYFDILYNHQEEDDDDDADADEVNGDGDEQRVLELKLPKDVMKTPLLQNSNINDNDEDEIFDRKDVVTRS